MRGWPGEVYVASFPNLILGVHLPKYVPYDIPSKHDLRELIPSLGHLFTHAPASSVFCEVLSQGLRV